MARNEWNIAQFDYINSHDDGCMLHDHCLTCPLEVCYFDKQEKGVLEPEARAARDDVVINMHLQGHSNKVIAEALGTSRSNVNTLLWKARKNGRLPARPSSRQVT